LHFPIYLKTTNNCSWGSDKRLSRTTAVKNRKRGGGAEKAREREAKR